MKTLRSSSLLRMSGSGLIEVLALIMIMSVGMLAMGKIHTVLMRDGGTANNRSIAATLAQEKLEDLRGFMFIATDATMGIDCSSNAVFCFSEINDDAGGFLASGNITVGNTVFTRNWTVTNGLNVKVVTVTVSWEDQNGVASMQLRSAIFGDDASITAISAGGGTQETPPGPVVSYTPIGVPDVVPINIGDGLSRETSRPLPDVSSKGFSVRTQFESVNYTAANKKASQDEFATVSCTCEFATTGPAFPPSYYVNNEGKLAVKYPTATVNKMTGTAPSIQGDSQDPLCTQCCRDHHDSNDTSTALYDPARPNSDYISGNHKHYYFSDANNPAAGLVDVSQTPGQKYLESCRFLRVDGFFRLMQDWRLVDNITMRKDGYLVDGTTALTTYQSFIADTVVAQAKTDSGTSTSANKGGLETRNITNAPTGLVQLMNRGIYVDRIYQTNSPRSLDTNYYTDLIADFDSNINVLNRIPFNEVNLTLLTSWSSNNTSVATVTNDPIRDITATDASYYGTYSRGRVSVLSGSGGSATITAHALPSNSGLTGGATRATYNSPKDYDGALAESGTIDYASEIGIDRDDHRSGTRKSDGILVTRASSTGTIAVEGVIKQGNISASLDNFTATGTDGVTCTVAAAVGSERTFRCVVNAGYSGTITASSTQTGAFVRGNAEGTSVSSTCNVNNITETFECPDFWVFGPTIELRGICGKYSGNGNDSCGNANNAKYTLTASNGTSVSCTTGSTLTCVVPLDGTTKTWAGTLTLTATGNNPIKTAIQSGNTIPQCSGSGVKTLSLTGLGPRDSTQTFAICAEQ